MVSEKSPPAWSGLKPNFMANLSPRARSSLELSRFFGRGHRTGCRPMIRPSVDGRAALERRPAHSRRAAMAAVADVLAIPAAHGRRLRGTDAPSLPAIARYSTISWPWRCGIGCARGTLGRGARASRSPLPGLEQGRNYGEALLTDRSGAADLGAGPGRLCEDAVDDVGRLVADAGRVHGRIRGRQQGCRVRGRPRRLLRGQSHQTQPEGIRSDGAAQRHSIQLRSVRHPSGRLRSPRRERRVAEGQPQAHGADRGTHRSARDLRVQSGARGSARKGVDELSRRARRPLEPDHDHQLRQGAARLRRAERGLLEREPPRALPREGTVAQLPRGGGGSLLLLLLPQSLGPVASSYSVALRVPSSLRLAALADSIVPGGPRR